MTEQKKLYFKNLDAIRFYAAMMVFLQHGFTKAFSFLPVDGTPIERILKLISSGGTGVSIFFVLSGFLITYLLIKEYEKNGKINVRNFYVRRFLRIWPLYYAVILFSFFFYPYLKELLGQNNLLATNPIYYIFFLSNFDVIEVQQNHFGLDAASQTITWSVAIEEQFYLFWPLVFLLKRKFWFPSIFIIGIGSMLFRVNNFDQHIVLYFHTFSVIVDLCVGGIIAYLAFYSNWFRNFLENTNLKFHLTVFSLLFITMYFGTKSIFGEYEIAFGRLIKTILFGLIIGSQALTKNQSFLNLGNFKFGTYWGKYTYGIYLLHPIVITIILAGLDVIQFSRDSFWKAFGVGIVALIGTLIISKLSYHYFEGPFLKLKSKFQVIYT